MGFNLGKFEAKSFETRTAIIKVPELKSFFDDDEATWEVRGISAQELGFVNEAVASNQDVAAIISAIASGRGKEKTDAIKDLVGIGSDTVPGDIVRRISMLTIGSVNPENFPQELAVKLGNTFPTTFFKLTNKIIQLTGMGQKPGE